MKRFTSLADTVEIKSSIYYEEGQNLYVWHNGDLDDADLATTAVLQSGNSPYVSLVMTKDRAVLTLQDPQQCIVGGFIFDFN